eukprot:CAMPEP_0174252114 /NCGR_PEP_ID=MMETSP0439-20130205/1725_1 /TAXON_ID=0 /ORGANISM="Stereomyxa ramosa, Strain Chinc5" /LENGTH=344 /DNA_ID=CAMNT_0015332611 /DNA_START=170 /DNA_END=1201 /DNA_ORIENTATION=-
MLLYTFSDFYFYLFDLEFDVRIKDTSEEENEVEEGVGHGLLPFENQTLTALDDLVVTPRIVSRKDFIFGSDYLWPEALNFFPTADENAMEGRKDYYGFVTSSSNPAVFTVNTHQPKYKILKRLSSKYFFLKDSDTLNTTGEMYSLWSPKEENPAVVAYLFCHDLKKQSEQQWKLPFPSLQVDNVKFSSAELSPFLPSTFLHYEPSSDTFYGFGFFSLIRNKTFDESENVKKEDESNNNNDNSDDSTEKSNNKNNNKNKEKSNKKKQKKAYRWAMFKMKIVETLETNNRGVEKMTKKLEGQLLRVFSRKWRCPDQYDLFHWAASGDGKFAIRLGEVDKRGSCMSW